MEISKSIFREYDIRGIYPEQINEQVVQKIAKAISVKCLNEGVSEICIARDGRLSGEKLLSALANSLSDSIDYFIKHARTKKLFNKNDWKTSIESNYLIL